MENNFTIQEVLNLIKEKTCLELKPCDYFVGIREISGRKYFNVILNQNIGDSLDYQRLLRFANKYKLIDVSPNGIKRVAIFPRIKHKPMRDEHQDHQEAIKELQEVANRVVAEYADLGVHIEPDEAQEIAKNIISLKYNNNQSLSKVFNSYFDVLRKSLNQKSKWKSRIGSLTNSGSSKR